MAVAKSDTTLREKEETTMISWTDWAIVDLDINNIHHKTALDLDNSWYVMTTDPPTREYMGLKKTSFVAEAWSWAFRWLNRKDRKRKKEKESQKSPKHEDVREKRLKGTKSPASVTFNSALEQELASMFANVVVNAVEEIVEENVLRNEKIIQKLLSDAIEAAWIEEECIVKKKGTVTKRSSGEVLKQLVDNTLKSALEECVVEERFNHKYINASEEANSNVLGRLQKEMAEADSRDELMANSLNQETEESEVQEEEHTDSTLSKHEKTMEKVKMFYENVTEEEARADHELIKRARQYVQDIIVVSLGILQEEQGNLKELSDEATCPNKVSKTDEVDAKFFDQFQNLEFQKLDLASGGGDSAEYKPKNVLDKLSLDVKPVSFDDRIVNNAIINEIRKAEMNEGNIHNENLMKNEAIFRKDDKDCKTIYNDEESEDQYDMYITKSRNESAKRTNADNIFCKEEVDRSDSESSYVKIEREDEEAIREGKARTSENLKGTENKENDMKPSQDNQTNDIGMIQIEATATDINDTENSETEIDEPEEEGKSIEGVRHVSESESQSYQTGDFGILQTEATAADIKETENSETEINEPAEEGKSIEDVRSVSESESQGYQTEDFGILQTETTRADNKETENSESEVDVPEKEGDSTEDAEQVSESKSQDNRTDLGILQIEATAADIKETESSETEGIVPEEEGDSTEDIRHVSESETSETVVEGSQYGNLENTSEEALLEESPEVSENGEWKKNRGGRRRFRLSRLCFWKKQNK